MLSSPSPYLQPLLHSYPMLMWPTFILHPIPAAPSLFLPQLLPHPILHRPNLYSYPITKQAYLNPHLIPKCPISFSTLQPHLQTYPIPMCPIIVPAPFLQYTPSSFLPLPLNLFSSSVSPCDNFQANLFSILLVLLTFPSNALHEQI